MPEQKSEEGEGTKDFRSVPHQKAKIERRERQGGRTRRQRESRPPLHPTSKGRDSPRQAFT